MLVEPKQMLMHQYVLRSGRITEADAACCMVSMFCHVVQYSQSDAIFLQTHKQKYIYGDVDDI